MQMAKSAEILLRSLVSPCDSMAEKSSNNSVAVGVEPRIIEQTKGVSMKTRKFFVCLLVMPVLFLFQASYACNRQPPEPPRQYWIINHGDPDGDGLNEYWVGIEVDLFNFNQPTLCQCGLGFSSPLPQGGQVKDAMVSVVDRRTHQIIGFVNAFNALTPNEETTANLNALQPGVAWFGLAGTIDPTELPQIDRETQTYKLWFKVIAPDLTGLAAVTAAGSSFDDPEHPIEIFRPENPGLIPPAPIPVDHSKCYEVRGEPLEVPLTLEDQFNKERIQPLEPALLCNPVAKIHENGETFGVEVGAHYVCYAFNGQPSPVQQVEVDNQFGRQKLEVGASRLLCLPSSKWHIE